MALPSLSELAAMIGKVSMQRPSGVSLEFRLITWRVAGDLTDSWLLAWGSDRTFDPPDAACELTYVDDRTPPIQAARQLLLRHDDQVTS